MTLQRRRRQITICSGPLLRNIFWFSVPIILSGALQMLFNAADTAIVGRFGSPTALASVGATSSLAHLIINVFLGLSTGAGVAVAQAQGAKNRDAVRRTVRTSAVLSVVGGAVVSAIGIVFCGFALRRMGTPDDVLPGSVLYMRIYFAGMPAIMLFDFGSSVLRSMGDTRRPLMFLTIAGAVNVVLNLLFVIGFHMDVAGVALATVLSQCGAAVLVVRCLRHLPHDIRLDLKRLGMDRDCLLKIMRIGFPAGLQSSMFSLSNVILQSSVNSLGSTAVAAQAAVVNADNLVSVALDGVAQSATTFSGQNFGAGDLRRVARTGFDASLLVTVFGLAVGLLAVVYARTFLSLFTANEAVLQMAADRMVISMSTYFLFGLMDVLSGALRGMGRSTMPMAVTLVGVCGLRVLWAYLVFPLERSLHTLFVSYPVSWGVTASVLAVMFLAAVRKERKKQCLS